MAKPTPGLKKRGNIWHIEKTICGSKVCRSTQSSDLSEAERYLEEVTKQIREKVIFGQKPVHNLDEAAAKYLLENKTMRGIARQGYALKPLVEWFGEVELSKIRPELFDEYIRQRTVSQTTLKREFGALRAVLTNCHTRWRDESGNYWLDRVPAFPKLDLNPRQPRPITHAEQSRLFAELPGYLAEMALFAVNTGCRCQEVCGLRWEWEMEVTGTQRTVFLIPGYLTKNGKDKIVPLNSIAASVIEARRGTHDSLVFSYEGHQLNRMTNRAWRDGRTKAGLKEVRVHDLRHTFAMRLRALDVSQEDIADLLGHSRGTITAHYSKATIERLMACVDKLADDNRKAELVLVKKRA